LEGATIKVTITQKVFRESYRDLRERAKLDFDFLLLTLRRSSFVPSVSG